MTATTPTVFYGICAEGMGHLSRALFLVPRLLEAGYAVELFTSGRAADVCQECLPRCPIHRVPGLRLRYRANRLDVARTTLGYMGLGLRGATAAWAVRRQARTVRPVAAISDYEPVLAWTCRALRLPLVALDHQQIATECRIDPEACGRLAGVLLRRSNRMTYLQPRTRIISSFFRPPLRLGPPRRDCTIVGPVLRREVLRRRASDGSHVVVYQTSRTLAWLDRILAALPGEKRVYGVGREYSGVPEREFSESTFLDDLASCRCVLVNGGHTTISEALHFGKPVLCLPVRGQAEQEINAHYVAALGFGCSCRPGIGEVPDFGPFLEHEPTIRRRILSAREACGNAELERIVLDRLDRWRHAGQTGDA
ncbi:MAG: hypothetical protein JXR77_16670 [Lentisphaeria bacterium]|nr:hypothetical protein [Lentisphaeria bacterium]